MDETRLIERAATGDALSFGALVRLHQSALRGFLLRMTRGDRTIADDLAQDTFLDAWRKIAQFRFEGSFAGWLYRIAYSRYLMAARRRKLEALEDTAAEIASPEPPRELRLDLERALARLAPQERAALTLCFALGYSHAEAANILDQPLGTLKSHVLRGRGKLKALLAPGEGES